MKHTLLIIAAFVGGLIAGWALIFFGWVAFESVVPVANDSGGADMGVAFGFAPMGAVVVGIVCAVIVARRHRAV